MITEDRRSSPCDVGKCRVQWTSTLTGSALGTQWAQHLNLFTFCRLPRLVVIWFDRVVLPGEWQSFFSSYLQRLLLFAPKCQLTIPLFRQWQTFLQQQVSNGVINTRGTLPSEMSAIGNVCSSREAEERVHKGWNNACQRVDNGIYCRWLIPSVPQKCVSGGCNCASQTVDRKLHHAKSLFTTTGPIESITGVSSAREVLLFPATVDVHSKTASATGTAQTPVALCPFAVTAETRSHSGSSLVSLRGQ